MKTRFLWACIIALVYAPLVNAYNHDDARYALQSTIDDINSRISGIQGEIVSVRESVASGDATLNDQIKKRLDELRDSTTKRIDELQASVSNLQAKVDSLWENGATSLDKTNVKANVALWITIPVVLVVCGILCLVFWPRKPMQTAQNPVSPVNNKCPRCGWEHDPDDTVCKNPKCKTQF